MSLFDIYEHAQRLADRAAWLRRVVTCTRPKDLRRPGVRGAASTALPATDRRGASRSRLEDAACGPVSPAPGAGARSDEPRIRAQRDHQAAASSPPRRATAAPLTPERGGARTVRHPERSEKSLRAAARTAPSDQAFADDRPAGIGPLNTTKTSNCPWCATAPTTCSRPKWFASNALTGTARS